MNVVNVGMNEGYEKNLLDFWQARFINKIFNFYVDRNKKKLFLI